MSRKQGKKTQVTIIRNKMKDISREPAAIKRMTKGIKKEYYKQFYFIFFVLQLINI